MKNFLRITSLAMVFALLVQIMPMSSIAQAVTKTDDIISTESSSNPIIGECEELRDKYTKVFEREDGDKIAVISPDAIHYEKDGKMVDIDNTMVESGKIGAKVLKNKENAFGVELPANLNEDKQIKVTNEGYTLAFKFLENLDSSSAKIQNTEKVTTDNKKKDVSVEAYEKSGLEKKSSVITYSEIMDNVDVEYVVEAEKLKENIILNEKPNEDVIYSYIIDAPKLTALVNKDSSIDFYAGKDKEDVKFCLPAPVMFDVNGIASDDIKVDLKKAANGSYKMTYKPSMGWLYNSELKYPVTVDPVIKTSSNQMTIDDSYVSSNNPTTNYGSGTDMFMQYNNKIPVVRLKFFGVGDISNAVITKANVYLFNKTVNGTGTCSVAVKEITSGGTWTETGVTWNDYADMTKSKAIDSNVVDLSVAGFVGWDITTLIKHQFATYDTFNGMVFESASNTAQDIQFASRQCTTSAQRPYYTIEYRNLRGINSGTDNHTQDIGRAGTGYVNDVYGALSFARTDMSFSSSPIEMTFYYNYYGEINTPILFTSMYSESITYYNYTTTLQPAYYILYLSDGGTRYLDISPLPEDHAALAAGEQYVIDEQTGEAYIIFQGIDTDGYRYYKLTDDALTCSKYYKMNDTSTSTNKLLYKTESLVDEGAVGESINIDINLSTGVINYIIDSRGYKYVFNYTSNVLTSVSYYGTGTTALSTVSYSIGEYGNLTITYPDNKQVKYEHNSVNTNIFKVSNTDGMAIEYTMATAIGDRKYVTKIQEIATNGTAGNYINITYGVNQTIFEDNSGNKQIENFDQYGNTISARDKDGNATFGAYGGNSGKGRNLLIGKSDPRRPTENILENGGFEDTNEASPITIPNPNAGVTVTPFNTGTVDNPAYAGSYSFKVNSTGANQDITKTVTGLSTGKYYTVSIWIRTVGNVNTNAQVLCNDGANYVDASECVKTNGKWQYVQVPVIATNGQANITISLNCGGDFYLDNMQLELANPANPYNYVENSDFTDGGNHWADASNSIGNQTTTFAGDSIGTSSKLDNNRRKLEGVVDGEITSYQRITINGKSGETYSFGGWACAEAALPISDTNGRALSIAVVIPADVTGDAEEELARIDYNTYITNWQFQESCFKLDEDCSAILIKLIYTNELNGAYFDGVEFFKDSLYKEFNACQYLVNGSAAPETTTEPDTESGSAVTYSSEKDAYGNITKSYSTNGQLSIEQTSTYTNDGNYLATSTDELGQTTGYTNNEQLGLLTDVEDAKNSIISYAYNAMQQNTSVAQTISNSYYGITSLSLSNAYTYNNSDNLSTINTANGTQYQFTYNIWGDISTASVGTTVLATFSYSNDADRRLTQITYANGQSILFEKSVYNGMTCDNINYCIGGTTHFILSVYYNDFGGVFYMFDHIRGVRIRNIDGITDEYETAPNGTPVLSHSYGQNDITNGKEFLESINQSTDIKSTYLNNTDDYSAIASININSNTSTQINHVEKCDDFGRLTTEGTYQGIVNDTIETSAIVNNYSYTNLADSKTSNQVSNMSITLAPDPNSFYKDYQYSYDAIGNITHVYNGANLLAHYEYDEAGQLIRINDAQQNKSFTYNYDASGNLLTKKEFAYTTGILGTATDTINYGYTDTNWKDKLTSYDGNTITYDASGNPLTCDGWAYTWECARQLKTMSRTGSSISYKYNSDGIRISKTVNGVETTYTVVDSRVTCQKTGSSSIYYFYDGSDNLVSLKYAGNNYLIVKNLQGDIIAITDVDGNLVVAYTYDAWGKLLSTTGSMASTLGVTNPFRYRGYLYDTETGLYYLQSRYYNPEMGRFINADDPLTLSFASLMILWYQSDVLWNNRFVYCINNPVNYTDYDGLWAEKYPGFKLNKPKGFDVNVHGDFMSKKFCLSYAKDIITLYGSSGIFCSMDAQRIATELYAHALLYYFGIGIINSKLLKKLSTYLIQHGNPITINNDDKRLIIYLILWNFA